MESRITIAGADPAAAASDLRSLRAWLRHEDELRGRVQLLDGEVGPEEMGGLAEVLVVALSAGGAATVLAQAVVEWVRQRTLDVTVRVTRPDGGSMEVQLSGVKAGDETVAALRRFITEEQPDALPDATP
ncbi:hypothetical protein ACFWOG_26680 [Kitasatospora sp. NPDC058406]|uniref:effector-associated constant component EACC1 n=1 Tax=Kitasatospora sp. NPDC058406 TaxID=3346483 RepID=UPI0036524237